ncbi:DUF6415 family natural product biosynthesis protein [Streptomyces sp. NPDC000880]
MPTERAQPPLEAAVLATVVAKLRAWNPLVVEAVFDDLNEVLGDQTPRADEIDEIAEELRGTLTQLVNIAVADAHFPADEDMATLVERAHDVRSEEIPGDYRAALGHTRRLAWTTWELLELLIATKQVRDAE